MSDKTLTAREHPRQPTRSSPASAPNPHRDRLLSSRATDVLWLQRIAGNAATRVFVQQRFAAERQSSASLRRDAAPESTSATSEAVTPVRQPLASKVAAMAILLHAFGSDLNAQQLLSVSTAPIMVVSDVPAFWSIYDDAQIESGNTSWRKGDAAKKIGTNTYAFHLSSTNQIYVCTPLCKDTTLVHELLHAGCAPDAEDVLGKVVIEGMTEYLAVVALQRANFPASYSAYYDALSFLNFLMREFGFGEGEVRIAFFKKPGGLRQLLEQNLPRPWSIYAGAAQINAGWTVKQISAEKGKTLSFWEAHGPSPLFDAANAPPGS